MTDTVEEFFVSPVLGVLHGVEGIFGNDGADNNFEVGEEPAIPGVPGTGTLTGAADQAVERYRQSHAATAATDAKVAALLKKVLASNETTRKEAETIINEMHARQQKLVDNPKLYEDPNYMREYGKFLNEKLTRLQQLMAQAKVDGTTQAELLGLLADEYKATAGTDDQPPKKNGEKKDDTTTDPPADGGSGGGGGGGTSGGGGGDPGAGAGGGVTDPMAGMGGLGGLGGGMGDPASMLGPALAGMSSLPGALGGLASSLPGAAAGLAPLAGQMAGDGFKDDASRDGEKPADFKDDHGKDSDDKKPDEAADEHDSKDKKPEASATPAAASPAAAAGAVPASAAGDPSLVVQMPDGSPVTATSGQHASAVRAVVNGTSVADAWKGAHVALPPPGTPITEPADPSHLTPGTVAQFKTREPVMYMGNGKIWLDGQLQPQSTLPTTDFLGWVDPAQQAGTVAAAAPTPKPAGT